MTETVALYAPLAKEKMVIFNYHVDQNVPERIYSDPVRIKQILNNILTNAIKYTNTGEINLDIQIINQQLKITLTNTCDKSVSAPGAGIGLFISSSLAKLLDGNLEFSSTTKSYSAVFLLPIKIFPVSSEKSNNTLLGETWIIEDNPLNLEIIESSVRAAGLNYRSFISAEKALEHFEKNSPAIFLAIIDINLHTVNGIDIADKLYSKSPHTYYIAHTGESWNSISKWIKSSRFQAVWTKPLNFDHAVLELNSLKFYFSSAQPDKVSLSLIDLIHPHMASSLTNKAYVKEFLLRLHESLNDSIDQLEKMNSEEKIKFIKVAHKLKGTAAQLSNPTLEVLSSEVESFLKNELYDEVKIRIPGLRFQTEQLHQLILKLS
jgi:CheY-like chemotaxis protein